MPWKNDFYKTLRTEFAELKEMKAGKFSLRAYAHKLKIPPSTLSQMLSGKQKWTLSVEKAAQLVENMSLPKARKTRLLTLMGRPVKGEFQKLADEDFEIFLNPLFSGVLYAFELSESERSAKKLAARFGQPVETIQAVLNALVKKNYLHKNAESGELQINATRFEVGDGPPSDVIRKFHKGNLSLAQKAIEAVPSKDRHFSTYTFAGTREQLAELKEEIRNFHERVSHLLADDHKNDEVYRVSLCIYPMRDFLGEKQP